MNGKESGDTLAKYGTINQWLKSCTIFASFLTFGLTKGSVGPTLSTFVAVYDSSVEVISYMNLATATGSIISALATGIIFDKYPKIRYFVICATHASWAILTMVRPILGNVIAFYAVAFFTGIADSVIVSGQNVLCIDIWRGRKAHVGNGVFHGIHFAYSIGFMIAPILCIPFLATDTQLSIRELHIILGAFQLALAAMYLIFAIKERNNLDKHSSSEESKISTSLTKCGYIFVAIVVAFFTAFNVMDGTIENYLPVFGEKSALSLTPIEAAKIASLVSGCFACTRLMGVFAAMKLKPQTIIITCLAVILAATIPLSINANTDYYIFCLGLSAMGLGRGPLYAAMMTWMEKNTPATNKIMGFVIVAMNAGTMIHPLITGRSVENHPMVMMYTLLISVIILIVIFALSFALARFAKSLTRTQ